MSLEMVRSELHYLLAQARRLIELSLLHQDVGQKQTSVNVIRVQLKHLPARDDRLGIAPGLSETFPLDIPSLHLALRGRSPFATAGDDDGDHSDPPSFHQTAHGSFPGELDTDGRRATKRDPIRAPL